MRRYPAAAAAPEANPLSWIKVTAPPDEVTRTTVSS
jgi:hypothetical protein